MTPDELAAARERLASEFPLVADHPDVAGVLRDADLLALVGRALAAPYLDAAITHVVAPEARGPIVGALAARELGAGLVLVRKADRNHPGADIHLDSSPTWRGHSERFQGRSFDLKVGDRALVVDDWITTGSSISAARDTIAACGATYAGASVLVDKADPAVIADLEVATLVAFDDLITR